MKLNENILEVTSSKLKIPKKKKEYTLKKKKKRHKMVTNRSKNKKYSKSGAEVIAQQ